MSDFLQEGLNKYDHGDFKNAINLYNMALAEDPNNAVVYYNRALAFQSLNQNCLSCTTI